MPDPVSLLPIGRRAAESRTAPDGSQVHLLLDGRHGATRCSMVEVSIAAGAVSRPVRHRTVEEVWYVLAGSGQVWRCPPGMPASDAASIAVSPGAAVAIPTGWSFQFRADDHSDAGLRLICVTVPAWPGMDEAVPVAAGGLGEPTLPAPPPANPAAAPQ